MDDSNKPERYWFKNKKYGIGWVPATWEGWLVLFAYIVGVIFVVAEPYYLGDGKFITGNEVHLVETDPISFFWIFGLLVLFMLVVIKKGEKLKPNFVSKFFNRFKKDE